MKKNIFLTICLAALLAVCVFDNRMQKKGEAQETVSENVEPVEEQIRVLLRNDDFASEYHERVTICSEGEICIAREAPGDGGQADGAHTLEAGERLELTRVSAEFGEENVLYLTSSCGSFLLPELLRAEMGKPYEGTLEVRRSEQGLLVINELPLETYLCSVVPSEMPAGYPKEALKAQAVCARTYAKKQKQEGRAAAFYADVDDSVSYQVYHNYGRQQTTDEAVEETAGMVMTKGGILIDALYYSTSCGRNLEMDLSGETVFAAFISENNIKAYEASEPWYRWQTEILLDGWENVTKLEITERNESGAAQKLWVSRSENDADEVIEGEYEIRRFLAGFGAPVTLQDGSVREKMELLPSAFFVLQPEYAQGGLYGYRVLGGGYGHGEGMSQNGAKQMALEGMDYKEILRHYYGEVGIQSLAGH